MCHSFLLLVFVLLSMIATVSNEMKYFQMKLTVSNKMKFLNQTYIILRQFHVTPQSKMLTAKSSNTPLG